MPTSKKRKTRKKVIKRQAPKIKFIKNSKKELLEGAKSMLERDAEQIVDFIRLRKETSKNSSEYETIVYQIKALIDSYNRSASLHNLPTLN